MKIRRLFDNIEVKLICLLLAVVVWLYANNPSGTETVDKFMKILSRGEQGKVTFRKVPVKLVGAEEEWEPIKDHETISIRARIEVQSLESEIDTGDLQAEVRLTKRNEQSKSVTLTVENVTLPKGLLFVEAEPEIIKITPIRK